MQLATTFIVEFVESVIVNVSISSVISYSLCCEQTRHCASAAADSPLQPKSHCFHLFTHHCNAFRFIFSTFPMRLRVKSSFSRDLKLRNHWQEIWEDQRDVWTIQLHSSDNCIKQVCKHLLIFSQGMVFKTKPFCSHVVQRAIVSYEYIVCLPSCALDFVADFQTFPCSVSLWRGW